MFKPMSEHSLLVSSQCLVLMMRPLTGHSTLRELNQTMYHPILVCAGKLSFLRFPTWPLTSKEQILSWRALGALVKSDTEMGTLSPSGLWTHFTKFCLSGEIQ